MRVEGTGKKRWEPLCPLIDGRGSRRRMRGRLDMVDRWRSGAGGHFVRRRDAYFRDQENLIFRELASLTVTRS
jgi:hypothetical protein